MRKNILVLSYLLLAGSAIIFSGCKRGEDDPFFSLHSRDARLTQKWTLTSMNGTIVNTFTDPDSIINVEYTYDGTNIYITENDSTVSFSYIFDMEIKNNGEVFSEEFFNIIETDNPSQQSSKTSFWFWGNDNKNKTIVNLDLTGLLAPYQTYHIPRLAWNDMTLEIAYSDNYTETAELASSINVNFILEFAVDLVE
jgi:hypothetical protein